MAARRIRNCTELFCGTARFDELPTAQAPDGQSVAAAT